jgi:hypothetical protein
VDRLQQLANATGLSLERIQQLDAQHQLHTLYDEWGQPVRQQANRSMTHHQPHVALAQMRWPKQRTNGKQAQLELLRIRGEWSLTRRQAEVNRLRAR